MGTLVGSHRLGTNVDERQAEVINVCWSVVPLPRKRNRQTMTRAVDNPKPSSQIETAVRDLILRLMPGLVERYLSGTEAQNLVGAKPTGGISSRRAVENVPSEGSVQ